MKGNNYLIETLPICWICPRALCRERNLSKVVAQSVAGSAYHLAPCLSDARALLKDTVDRVLLEESRYFHGKGNLVV